MSSTTRNVLAPSWFIALTDGLLFDSQGRAFATGAAQYLESAPENPEESAKVYIEVQFDGAALPVLAQVDTGAVYCIPGSEVMDQLRPHLVDSLGPATLSTRLGRFKGELYLHSIRLLAHEGDALDVDVVLFVCPDWLGPCFLGYAGALDRLRSAIDPAASRFCFGPR